MALLRSGLLGAWLGVLAGPSAGGCSSGATEPAALDAGADAALAAPDAGAPGAGSGYGAPVTLGRLADVLPETSGIAASRTQPGVFWVENDSGNPADLFAVDRSATLLATIHLQGATNVDWEDLSIHEAAAGDELYVADVGDNAARTSGGATGRAGIRVYRLAEPDAALGDATLAPVAFDFRYPSRPYDCEGLFVDHRTGDVYFVTKEDAPAELFVARAPLVAGVTTTLEHVGTLGLGLATAADMSRDSTRIVVRGYASIQVYTLGPDVEVAAALAGPFVTARPAAAAEAIAFEADGYGLYTVPEGVGAWLFYLPWE